ncbi:MAG: flagellar hook-length control protein FliK [Thermodesulfobacteriota bacterium]|nr:flagellar hook-length control protein FliK [Thermodesulfobacteriota bacterium]
MLPVNFQFEEMLADVSAKKSSHVAGIKGQEQTVSFEDMLKRVGRALHERKNSGEKSAIKNFEDKPSTAQTVEIVKKQMLANGIDPRSVNLDKSSLETLKRILTAAGLEEDALAGIFEGLLAESADGTVNLADLFSALNANAADLAGDMETARLDASAIPYLKTVLTRLGISREAAGEMIDEAVSKNGDLNVKTLLSDLKAFADQQADAHLLTADGEKNTRQALTALLSKIGINTGKKEDSPVTLKSVIQGLENMLPDKTSPKGAGKDFSDQLARFIQTVQSGNTGNEGRMDTPHIEILGEKTVKDRIKGMATANSKTQADSNEKAVPNLKATGAEGSKADDATASKLFKEALGGRQGAQNNDNYTNRLSDVRAANITAGSGQSAAGVSQAGQNGTSHAAEKPLPAFVLNQVGRQVVRAVQNNQNTVTIQLKPPELGRLSISIETVGHTLKVNILAEQSSARDLLMSHTSDLKAVVSEHHQGFRVEKVDVQLSQNFDQAMADTRNGKDQGGAGSRRKGSIRTNASGVVGNSNADDDGPPASAPGTGSRLLNLIA